MTPLVIVNGNLTAQHYIDDIQRPTDFFKHGQVASYSKDLKEDCYIFSQLFISCQSRQYDLKISFSIRTSQPLPP